MAITKAYRIRTIGIADGASTSFVLNVLHDPYLIGSGSPGGASARMVNWFADIGAGSVPKPVGVKVIDGATSAVLNTSTLDVTITVPVKAAGTRYTITMDLLF
jgi:hypothetical protein